MSSPMPSRARLVATYSGRVQGVGFRATTRSLASSLPLAGFVKNLSDGKVLLVAEGQRDDIEKLLRDLGMEMGGLITAAEILWEAPRDEFGSFEIRR